MYADMPQEMPAWFSGVSDFVTKLFPEQQALTKQQQEDMINVMKILDVDGARIVKLEKVLLKLEEWKRICFNALKAETTQRSVPRQEQLVDHCEVRVSNIPDHCELGPFEIAVSVLSSIGCGHLCSHIVDARVWNIPDSRPSTRSIVFQFNSPISRNKAMRNASRLSKLTASDILGTTSHARLYMNQLLPKSLYILYRRACDRARELGYLRPFVRDLQICVRKSRDCPLILINAESDLSALENNVDLHQSETVETTSSITQSTTDVKSHASEVSDIQIKNCSNFVNPTTTEHTVSNELNTSNTTKKFKRKDKKKVKSRAHVKR